MSYWSLFLSETLINETKLASIIINPLNCIEKSYLFYHTILLQLKSQLFVTNCYNDSIIIRYISIKCLKSVIYGLSLKKWFQLFINANNNNNNNNNNNTNNSNNSIHSIDNKRSLSVPAKSCLLQSKQSIQTNIVNPVTSTSTTAERKITLGDQVCKIITLNLWIYVILLRFGFKQLN